MHNSHAHPRGGTSKGYFATVQHGEDVGTDTSNAKRRQRDGHRPELQESQARALLGVVPWRAVAVAPEDARPARTAGRRTGERAFGGLEMGDGPLGGRYGTRGEGGHGGLGTLGGRWMGEGR